MSDETRDLASGTSNCIVSYSSCGHEEVASSRNIIDGSRSTFWATTGLYPQSFILSFPKIVELNGITIRSYCVKSIVVERCSKDLASGFEGVKSIELQLTDLHHQISKMDVNSITAQHLRFTIADGYQEFCAIYKVEVLGKQSK